MSTKSLDQVTSGPDKLMEVFSRNRLPAALLFAAIIHVIVILGFSTSYIMTNWLGIAPEVAETDSAVESPSANGEEAPPEGPDEVTESVTAVEVVEATPTASPSPSAIDEIPEDRKDSEMVQRITELPAPGEIPEQPTDIGISLEDTTPGGR